MLDIDRLSFLFTSDILLKFLNITPSVKTKLTMISMIGPRLIDPKTKYNDLVDLFRFAEEKEKVEDILKARIQTLNSSIFNKNVSVLSPGGGPGGSRGRKQRPISINPGRGSLTRDNENKTLSQRFQITPIPSMLSKEPTPTIQPTKLVDIEPKLNGIKDGLLIFNENSKEKSTKSVAFSSNETEKNSNSHNHNNHDDNNNLTIINENSLNDVLHALDITNNDFENEMTKLEKWEVSAEINRIELNEIIINEQTIHVQENEIEVSDDFNDVGMSSADLKF